MTMEEVNHALRYAARMSRKTRSIAYRTLIVPKL
jgi:hypothetical protein